MARWLESGRERGAALDLRFARSMHQAVRAQALQRLMVAASRLGDAPTWLLVVLAMPWLDTVQGRLVCGVGLGLGTANLLIYWLLKRGTRRARPFQRCSDIVAGVRAPDRFSFPSGHTLHAVSFAVLLGAAFPLLAPLLAVFAALVGVSRVVLGVHFPTDVLAGAAIGLATALLAVAFLP